MEVVLRGCPLFSDTHRDTADMTCESKGHQNALSAKLVSVSEMSRNSKQDQLPNCESCNATLDGRNKTTELKLSF